MFINMNSRLYTYYILIMTSSVKSKVQFLNSSQYDDDYTTKQQQEQQ
jgi:hypothetical protein